MAIVYILLVTAVILFAVDFAHGFRLAVSAYATASVFTARLGYRRPIVTVEFEREDTGPLLTVCVFGLKILRKNMAAGRKPGGAKKGLRLVRAASVSGVGVSAGYGLGDPFSTAMAFAVTGAAARLLPVEQLEVEPDFLSDAPYLSVRAHATVRFGKTILNYIQNKR